MVQVQTFSKGKTSGRNEDFFGYNKSCIVIADGVTDKSGKLYSGKTGGELASRLVVAETLATALNGQKLINVLNNGIRKLYQKFGISRYAVEPRFRFGCVFIAVRFTDEKAIITYLGDLGFRINGVNVYQETIKIEKSHSEERARYIQETNDVAGSRMHLMPLLLEQLTHQNCSGDVLGYGVIDGTKTPPEYVKTFEYARRGLKTIELFTDGYFKIPEKVSIEAWEKAYRQVEREDPDKWKKYKATKSKDDRTVVLIHC
ncbi:MAG: hypothetical protein PHY34_03860 [Patescibacteria group bacterium]|nr:hypothetical protein [Patescibacteria group bacterium]